jgi:hypothetical protein
MTYQEALQATISTGLAVDELQAHGFTARVSTTEIEGCEPLRALYDLDSGDHIATINNGEVNGADVLDWLGY